jgi:acyl-CoA-binding protein
MSDLKAQFDKALQDVQKLPKKPDTATMLSLYALFKQASSGDCTGKRPGITDPVGKAKFDAWSKLSGTSKDKAMQDYISLVEQQGK